MRKSLALIFASLLAGCSLLATPLPTPTPTAAPTATRVVPTLTPTQTLAPFEEYTIEYLRRRPYGGGRIEVLETLSETERFTSYSFRYPSDGLTIYGFVNVPKGDGPFPVIVSIHGYAPSGKYEVFAPSSDSADYLAERQLVVIHPGLRNHPPSDAGENLLRVGMTIDVMNLIALLKHSNNLPAELAAADPDRLGLWGTSMGGEIALRVITINQDIQAVVLYSSLGGDPARNSKHLYDVIRADEFLSDAQIPLEMNDRISPMNYYYRITAAVQLHHGTQDQTAPISWAAETCDFLQAAGVSVECIYYQDADHLFGGEEREHMLQSALNFYRLHLTPH